ncbi:MAG: hypothetical protein EBX37_13595, partial [Alphaproteobacteria bacterium]|nr:hypothetical protein [Alphaproteobacteria bacterium]
EAAPAAGEAMPVQPAEAPAMPDSMAQPEAMPQPAQPLTAMPAAGLAASPTATAPAAPVLAREPLPLSLRHGVTYVTGGTTQQEIEQFRSMDAEFNLQVLFAAKNNDHLVVQSARILDYQGFELVASYAAGPYFYAYIRPGDYVLEIVYEAGAQPVKVKVTVPAKGRVRKTILLK